MSSSDDFSGRPSARDVARRVIGRALRDGAFVRDALDDELRRAHLDDRDRALATELAYGVIRMGPRLDRALAANARRGLAGTKLDVRIALRVAAYQLLFLDRVPAHAAVNDAARAVSRRGQSVVGFVNGILRALARAGEPALPEVSTDPVGAAVARHAMPPALVQELARSLDAPDELFQASAALSARPPLWLRPNRLRTDAAGVVAALASEGITAVAHGDAVRAESMGGPDATRAFADGLYTVQDRAAQWVGELAAPARGSRVLDACAGLGGKTTHLAELGGSALRIDAVDRSAPKLEQLRASAERLGVSASMETLAADLTGEVPGLARDYDGILLDAPCTGVGVLRRHPEIKARYESGAIDAAALAVVQERLLEALAPRVKPGGWLVYAVCSFRVEEGPDRIERFLAAHPAFRVDPAAASWPAHAPPPDDQGFLRTWPHRDDADAFFAARLVRAA